MWAHAVQVMFGCWLAISPFVFSHASEEVAFWINDFSAGAAVVVFSTLSFWNPTRRAHLGNLAVGVWLIGFGFLMSDAPAPPALQNNIMVGILLVMFGIIPPHCDQPPRSWREYIDSRSGRA